MFVAIGDLALMLVALVMGVMLLTRLSISRVEAPIVKRATVEEQSPALADTVTQPQRDDWVCGGDMPSDLRKAQIESRLDDLPSRPP
jgi:hypothetical protein